MSSFFSFGLFSEAYVLMTPVYTLPQVFATHTRGRTLRGVAVPISAIPYHILFPSVVLCESYSLLRSLSHCKRHGQTLEVLPSSFQRATPHSKRLTFAASHSSYLLGDLLRPYQEHPCSLRVSKPSKALGPTDLPQQQNLLGSQSLSTV